MGICHSTNPDPDAHQLKEDRLELAEAKTASDSDGTKSMRIGTSHDVALSQDTFERKTNTTGITLYVGKFCPFSLRCQIALAEKGTQYTTTVIHPAGKQAPNDFLAIQPSGLVPVLVHDGKVVPESWDILKYIEANQMRILSNTSPVHRETIAAQASLIPIPIYDQVVKRYGDVEATQKALAEFLTCKVPAQIPRVQEAFNAELKSWDDTIIGPYHYGKDFTVVDIGLWSLLARIPALAAYKKYKVPSEYVKLNAWLETVSKRPSVLIHKYKEQDFIAFVERMARPGPASIMNQQHAALRKHMGELETSHPACSSPDSRTTWLTSLKQLIRMHHLHSKLEDTILFDALKQITGDLDITPYNAQHHELDAHIQTLGREIHNYEQSKPVEEVKQEQSGELSPRLNHHDTIWKSLGEQLVGFKQAANAHMDAEESVLPAIIGPTPWESQSQLVHKLLSSLLLDEISVFLPWILIYQNGAEPRIQFIKALKFAYAQNHPEAYQQYIASIKASVSEEIQNQITPVL